MLDRDGYLEEALFHEAAHVSLDPEHADAAGWSRRMEDSRRRTPRDHPDREDVAESVLAYSQSGSCRAGFRRGSERRSKRRSRSVLEYFDEQALHWSPYMSAVPALPLAAVGVLTTVLLAAHVRRRRPGGRGGRRR